MSRSSMVHGRCRVHCSDVTVYTDSEPNTPQYSTIVSIPICYLDIPRVQVIVYRFLVTRMHLLYRNAGDGERRLTDTVQTS
jgi:hypothetical protein